jgi:hypothetical protein
MKTIIIACLIILLAGSVWAIDTYYVQYGYTQNTPCKSELCVGPACTSNTVNAVACFTPATYARCDDIDCVRAKLTQAATKVWMVRCEFDYGQTCAVEEFQIVTERGIQPKSKGGTK